MLAGGSLASGSAMPAAADSRALEEINVSPPRAEGIIISVTAAGRRAVPCTKAIFMQHACLSAVEAQAGGPANQRRHDGQQPAAPPSLAGLGCSAALIGRARGRSMACQNRRRMGKGRRAQGHKNRTLLLTWLPQKHLTPSSLSAATSLSPSPSIATQQSHREIPACAESAIELSPSCPLVLFGANRARIDFFAFFLFSL